MRKNNMINGCKTQNEREIIKKKTSEKIKLFKFWPKLF